MSHQQRIRDFLLISLACAINGREQTAIRGRDAILPYQYPCDGVVTLLEWIRPDLDSQDYVFFYRNSRPYELYQNPRYRGRVELTDPAMKGGDVSITVRNVSAADSGEYKCRINVKTLEQSESKIIEFWDVINLRVTDSGQIKYMKTSELQNNIEDVALGNLEFQKEKENTPSPLLVGAGVACVAGVFIAATVGIVKSNKCRQDFVV